MAASFSPGFAGTPNLASAHRSTPDCLNPFDINPLRAIIEKLFDFERIRRESRSTARRTGTAATPAILRFIRWCTNAEAGTW